MHTAWFINSYIIFLHASAQFRQAAAQALQWSVPCLLHSSAHASQASAHILHNDIAFALPKLMSCAAA